MVIRHLDPEGREVSLVSRCIHKYKGWCFRCAFHLQLHRKQDWSKSHLQASSVTNSKKKNMLSHPVLRKTLCKTLDLKDIQGSLVDGGRICWLAFAARQSVVKM